MSGEVCGCGRPIKETATDECVNVEHRATDATLGLRDLSCGCCYAVDATALELLRHARVPSTSEGEGA